MIIHFNGMPGVGKFTVAKLLAESLNARLIDNHAVINVAYLCSEHGSDVYERIVNSVIDIVYKELANQPKEEIILFTNCLEEHSIKGAIRFNKVVKLAEERDVRFVPILLECSKQENLTRATNPERSQKQKLTNQDILNELIKKHTIIHPQDNENAIKFDSTGLTAEETASRIEAILREKLFYPARKA
jgi:broad-specificity NMP kinase